MQRKTNGGKSRSDSVLVTINRARQGEGSPLDRMNYANTGIISMWQKKFSKKKPTE